MNCNNSNAAVHQVHLENCTAVGVSTSPSAKVGNFAGLGLVIPSPYLHHPTSSCIILHPPYALGESRSHSCPDEREPREVNCSIARAIWELQWQQQTQLYSIDRPCGWRPGH